MSRILEEIKWFLGVGWEISHALNGGRMGEVEVVYENKKTGERRSVYYP